MHRQSGAFDALQCCNCCNCCLPRGDKSDLHAKRLTFCKSARLHSNTRPLRPSAAICKRVQIKTWSRKQSRRWYKRVAKAQRQSQQEGPPQFDGAVHTLVPAVRVTKVLPTLRTVNAPGALMSYQSFLVKGSTLRKHRCQLCQWSRLPMRSTTAL